MDGVPHAYDNPTLQAYLDGAAIQYLPQEQYMDRFVLTEGGLGREQNTETKLRLGLPTPMGSK